jgi:hypothetical protein
MPWRNIANQPLVKSELSGQMVSTWSEAWRHECEIAYLLAMPLAKRNIFLDGVQGGTGDERGIKGVRGEMAVSELRAAIERLSEIRRRG